MKEYKTLLPEIKLTFKDTEFKKVKMLSSQEVNNYAHQFYFDDINFFESMFMILLNRQNNTIGFVKISQGGTAGTVCDVKLILKYAIEGLASGFILVHNHPSGNTKPSINDHKITQKIKKAANIMDIALIDHLIVTPERQFYSFADNGDI